MAAVVGVELPGAEFGAASNVVIAAALAARGGASAVADTVHASRLLGDAKSLRPQFTAFSTVGRKLDIVVVATVHFEVRPHPGLRQDMPVRSSCMEPDRSKTIRMSGGTLVAIGFVMTQVTFASDSKVLFPSFCGNRTSTEPRPPASILICASEAVEKLHAAGRPPASRIEISDNERLIENLRRRIGTSGRRIAIETSGQQGQCANFSRTFKRIQANARRPVDRVET